MKVVDDELDELGREVVVDELGGVVDDELWLMNLDESCGR